jgi:energy-coupling factor transport system substrate-specific component
VNATVGKKRDHLDVRDFVLIALLSAAGGALSTYVGYLGNLVNRVFGVPFGAGQLISGLHILWPLLARALVGRFGAGTLTGLTKGVVELFSGGTHGAVIVLVSGIEGLFVDFGLGLTRRRSLPITMLAGALASASNVVVFQAIYFSGVAAGFLWLMIGLALVSGAVFGGYLAWDVERLLVTSRILRPTGATPARIVRPTEAFSASPHPISWWRRIAVLSFAVAFLAGVVYFYLEVARPAPGPNSAAVSGDVAAPYTFSYAEWSAEARTVRTELRGSVSYVPPADYTGVPLRLVLERAAPRSSATRVRVAAADGYEASFQLHDVATDVDLLLTAEGKSLRLVAPGRDGALWVREVVRLVIE